MPTYGTHDFQFLDFGNQNINSIANQTTAAGVSFADILGAANSAMAETTNIDPVIASLVVDTDQEEATPDYSAAFQLEYGSEYAVARPQRAEEVTHSLPIRRVDLASQFTEDFLDNVSEIKIANHLQGIVTGYKNGFEAMILDAFFNPAAIAVRPGSATMSPKFIGYTANDPAYGKVVFPDGERLASPYSHYISETPANLLAAIRTAVERVRRRRGFTGPLDIYPSQNAAEAISALPEFVDAGDALVRVGTGTEEAMVDSNTYIGVIKGLNVRVRQPVNRVLDNATDGAYWFGVATPDFAPPIAWRYDSRRGKTPRLRSRSLFPLDYATVIAEAGFGVNDRFAAAVVKISTAGGAYTPPVIRG